MEIILIILIAIVLIVCAIKIRTDLYESNHPERRRISSFAQGLIKSIKETPQDWRCDFYVSARMSHWVNTELDPIELLYRRSRGIVLSDDYYKLTPYESKVLGQAMKTHLIERYLKTFEKVKAKNAQVWEELAHSPEKG